jgi:hypothetical protein
MVAIETAGELGVKGAIALLQQQEVEVEALPTDLPEGFEIDLSALTNIGDEVKFADLNYDKNKVELLVEDLEDLVLVVNEVKEEAEEASTEVADSSDATASETTPEATPAAD